MVKDHTDSERGNTLTPQGLLFPIDSKGSHRHDGTYHGLCYTSRGTLAGTRHKRNKKGEKCIFNAGLKIICYDVFTSVCGIKLCCDKCDSLCCPDIVVVVLIWWCVCFLVCFYCLFVVVCYDILCFFLLLF